MSRGDPCGSVRVACVPGFGRIRRVVATGANRSHCTNLVGMVRETRPVMGAPFSTRLQYDGGEPRCCGVAVHRFWSWTILGQSDYDSTDAARVLRAPYVRGNAG